MSQTLPLPTEAHSTAVPCSLESGHLEWMDLLRLWPREWVMLILTVFILKLGSPTQYPVVLLQWQWFVFFRNSYKESIKNFWLQMNVAGTDFPTAAQMLAKWRHTRNMMHTLRPWEKVLSQNQQKQTMGAPHPAFTSASRLFYIRITPSCGFPWQRTRIAFIDVAEWMLTEMFHSFDIHLFLDLHLFLFMCPCGHTAYVCGFYSCVPVSIRHMYVVPTKGNRRCQSIWRWSYMWLWVTYTGAGNHLRSSGRCFEPPNHLSSSVIWCPLNFYYFLYYYQVLDVFCYHFSRVCFHLSVY